MNNRALFTVLIAAFIIVALFLLVIPVIPQSAGLVTTAVVFYSLVLGIIFFFTKGDFAQFFFSLILLIPIFLFLYRFHRQQTIFKSLQSALKVILLIGLQLQIHIMAKKHLPGAAVNRVAQIFILIAFPLLTAFFFDTVPPALLIAANCAAVLVQLYLMRKSRL